MRCTILFSMVLFIAMNSFSQSTVHPVWWPQFRGPNCSGIAEQDASPPAELSDQTLLWKTELPVGHSSPCIWGNDLFLTAFIQDNSELQTICIDRVSGLVQWRKSIFPEKIEGTHTVSNPAQTSPATDGERVYVYFGSYGILCYSRNGDLLWDYKIKVHPYRWGVTSSPVLFEDKIIISRDIANERRLFALDKLTGSEIWNTRLPDHNGYWTTNWATPVLYKDQIILHRGGEIASYSVNDGRRIWWLPYLAGGESTPVVHNDIIYVGTWHNYSEPEFRGDFPKYHDFSVLLSAFDMNHDSLIQENELPDTLMLAIRPEGSGLETENHRVKEYFGMFDKNKATGGIDRDEWESTVNWITGDFYKAAGLLAIKPSGEGEQAFENVLWREIEKVPEVPSPLFYKGLVYMCKNGGILTCMDAENGAIKYRERIGQKGNYYASPVVANDRLYFPSGKGLVTVIRAGDELEVLSQNDLHEDIFASPAIIGDTIYIRTTEHLFAFGK